MVRHEKKHDDGTPEVAERPHGRLTYTVAEAAHQLGVSESYVYVLMANGRLQALKLGRRTMITDAAMRDLLSKLPTVEEQRLARLAAAESKPLPIPAVPKRKAAPLSAVGKARAAGRRHKAHP
jgi:excisionase family DNA binding protein